MNAREEILARARAAAAALPAPAAPPTPPAPPGRGYRRKGTRDRAALVRLLADRLTDYRATVHHCDHEVGTPPGRLGGLAVMVARLLAGSTSLVVPADLPPEWLAAYSGAVRRDPPVAELDAPGVSVLTGCAVAIAETGTIVLDAGRAQGRRVLTLVPDHHVCVVRADQIVAGVPEGLARLPDPTRPLTLISGPSATSDIELDRVEGVHGPRRLEVILTR